MSNFFFHETAVIDSGCKIGAGTKIWHFSHIMSDSVIGENCVLGQNVMVAKNVIIGNNVKIQNNVSVYEGVTIEDSVFVGPSVVFTNVINPRAFVERKHEFRRTLLRRGVSLGANATVVCGVEIGAFAMVGAGAVVTKSVPDFALVTGNPARITGWVSEVGCKLVFDDSGFAVCPETGEKYFKCEDVVRKVL